MSTASTIARSARPPLSLEAFIEKHRKAFEWDMTTFDALDNPIWESLTSTHANMAWSNGSARRYANQVSPLAAVSKPTPTTFSDLAALVQPEEHVGLFTSDPLHLADDWETIRSLPIEQMICTDGSPRCPLSSSGATTSRVGTDSASTWVIVHYFVTVYRFHAETEITVSDTRIARPQLSDFILWG